MKICIVNGSRRRNGNTAGVLEIFENELRRSAARRGIPMDIVHVRLGETRIEPCRGCRACFDRGESACPVPDELGMTWAVLRHADGLVLASPVYVNDVSGTMKNLIDRLGFVCHRPALWSTTSFLLATTGGSPARHALRTLQGAVLSWGGTLAGAASFPTGALLSLAQVEQRHGERIRRAAGRFFAALERRSHLRPSFVNLLQFRIQQAAWRRADPERVDYRYWREHGWFQPGRTWFGPHRANPLAVAAAWLVGRALARVLAGA